MLERQQGVRIQTMAGRKKSWPICDASGDTIPNQMLDLALKGLDILRFDNAGGQNVVDTDQAQIPTG